MEDNWFNVMHSFDCLPRFSVHFLQIIDELTSRLELRESQLLALSKDKARLEEEFDNLKE